MRRSQGDVRRYDSQRRFLAQHSVAVLEQCCNYSKQCRNNIAMLCWANNRCGESSRVTIPLKLGKNSGERRIKQLKSKF